MSAAREEILARVRRALSDVPDAERPDDVVVARAYRRGEPAAGIDVAERFAERVSDYQATVRTVAAGDVAGAVTRACSELGLRRIVIPPGLPETWRPADVEVIEDAAALTAHDLDALDAAVTGCAVAIAETGTIVLDGQGASGRRAITLVPDHHICIVERRQIRASVPEGLADVADAVREHGVPVTLVSGPSASSDIELTRVEGVHGPRNLLVLIVESE